MQIIIRKILCLACIAAFASQSVLCQDSLAPQSIFKAADIYSANLKKLQLTVAYLSHVTEFSKKNAAWIPANEAGAVGLNPDYTINFDKKYSEGKNLVVPCAVWSGKRYQKIEFLVGFANNILYWRSPKTKKIIKTSYQESFDEKSRFLSLNEQLAVSSRMYEEFQNITDPDTLLMAIEKLTSDKKFLYSTEEAYETFVQEALFSIFLTRLMLDFEDSTEFVTSALDTMLSNGAFALRKRMNNPNDTLFQSFKKISASKETEQTRIAFYGVLLAYLTTNISGYLEKIYDVYTAGDHFKNLALARKGFSYHNRGNSVVHFYSKGLLFGDEKREYMESIRRTSGEKKVEDRRQTENAKKIEKACKLWDKRVKRHSTAGSIARLLNFYNKTSVVEIDTKTALIFSDADNGVAHPVHSGRSRQVIYISKAYLDQLEIDNTEDIAELALWLYFGQKYIDLQDEMLREGHAQKEIERKRASLNEKFFENEQSGFMQHDKLRKRLIKRIKADTLFKYSRKLPENMRLEMQADELVEKGNAEVNRDLLGEAFNLYGRLVASYSGLGAEGKAKDMFTKMQKSASELQLIDDAILPYQKYHDLIFVALRFGYWEEFGEELSKFLSGKGFKRPIKKGERTHIFDIVTRRNPEKPREKTFEKDMESGLYAQRHAAPYQEKRKINAEIRKARKELDRFFNEQFNNLKETDYIPDDLDLVKAEKVRRQEEKYSREERPLLLQKTMPDYNFTGNGKTILIPGGILEKLYHAAQMRRLLDVELYSHIKIKDGVAVEETHIEDPKQVFIIRAGKDRLASNVRLDDRNYYSAGIVAFDLLLNWAELIGQENKQLRSDYDQFIRVTFEKVLGQIKSIMEKESLFFDFYSLKDQTRVKLSIQNLEYFLKGTTKDLLAFANDMRHVKVVATKWFEPYEIYRVGEFRDKNGIIIHTHPLGYPAPPSGAINPIGKKVGDIYTDNFLHGQVSGVILDTKNGDELVLFYEPDERNENKYLALFQKYWEGGKDILEGLRKLGMKAAPVSKIEERPEGKEDIKGLTAVRDIVEKYGFKKLGDEEGVAKCMSQILMPLLLNRKVTLVIQKELGTGQMKNRLIEKLKEMKKDKQFEKLLGPLEILDVYGENIVRVVSEIKENPKQKNDVYVFANENLKETFDKEKTFKKHNIIYIEERQFPTGAYYPIFEIIILSLAKFSNDIDIDNLIQGLKEIGIELNMLNISSVNKPSKNVLLFQLLPNAKEHEKGELQKKYSRIMRFLRAA